MAKKTESAEATVSIRMPKDLLSRVDQLARADDRTRTSMLIVLIKSGLEANQ